MTSSHFVAPDPDFWHQRRVLVTGHTGFKGSWLALWLLKLGAKVSGLSLAPDTSPSLFEQLGLKKRLNHRLGDIRDACVVQQCVADTKPDVVFHLSAQPLVRRSYQEPADTWATNVMGTIHLLDALRNLYSPCTAVLITTDKVYRNNEWLYGYRENDPLGGSDPYSSSKAAAELAISSWRASFCGSLPHQTPHLRLASARAGNVIGGGDWALDRIVPDAMRALGQGQVIGVRNPGATRPWQHVLEPLSGYLCLAERLSSQGGAGGTGEADLASSFNFGPQLEANRPVQSLVEEALGHWPGSWIDQSDPNSPHEASLLNLVIDKAHHQLGWTPRWNFTTTVERTVRWYRKVEMGEGTAVECCLDDLSSYSGALQA